MHISFNNYFSFAFLISLLFLLSACSSTKMTEEWNDPEYKGPALEKILIIGIIKSDSRRRQFEDDFSRLISTKNRKAFTSYKLLPNLKGSGKKEDVLKAIEKVGADGVIIVTTHGVYQQSRDTVPSIDYIPGAGRGYGYGGYGGYGMYGHYNASHSYIFNQGYTVSDTILRVDTKLFNAATEKVIWTGKTKTINPSSVEEVIQEFENLIIPDMQRHGLIK